MCLLFSFLTISLSKFFFVTSKKDGKGLGLSVVSSGLEEIGANIDVFSDNGSTCFRINFPQGMN